MNTGLSFYPFSFIILWFLSTGALIISDKPDVY
jgi:hypothetical protein